MQKTRIVHETPLGYKFLAAGRPLAHGEILVTTDNYTTLISTSSLADLLDDPNVIVIDCRFDLNDPQKGQREYAAGHIRGALYANLDEDLAAPVSAESGRHPLPDPGDFQDTLRRYGASAGSQIVVYDDAGGALAARLWWMMRRWLGHGNVAVLDGGFAAWTAAGRPVSTDPTVRASGNLSVRARRELIMTTQQVLDALAGPGSFVLVDARAPQRFRGDIEPIDAVAGHIPGTVNLPFSRSLDDQGLWQDATALRATWDELASFEPGQRWAVMCGSGVTACHLALSAELAGLPEPLLYVGSWSEWIRDPGRPVASGVPD